MYIILYYIILYRLHVGKVGSTWRREGCCLECVLEITAERRGEARGRGSGGGVNPRNTYSRVSTPEQQQLYTTDRQAQ